MNRADYIRGAFVTANHPDGEIELRSPADTSDLIGHFTFAKEQVDLAVSAAREAQRGWWREGTSARQAAMKRFQERVRARRDEIAHAISREIGKPMWEARGEVDAMIGKVDLSMGEGSTWIANKQLQDLPGEIRFRPHGVMAVLGPFNFPGHLPNGHIVPALLAGNTVVFKPSDKGPSTALLMAQCFHEAQLPPGVFNVVQGGSDVAETVVRHDGIDGILFTGSAPVGQRILALNAHRPGVLIALELGGKNASIVLDDCNLERSARQIAFSGFATCGQRCTATSRVIATKGIARKLAERVAELARGVTVGHPADDGVFMGPIISEASRERVVSAVQKARAAGFEALEAGGPIEARTRGNYLRPSVHMALRADAHVDGYTHEELFGPDLCFFEANNLEHAVALANDTKYGLSCAVYTASRDQFEYIADELRVGVVHWNKATAGASSRLPFGGIGQSGNHHPAGIMASTSCAYPLAVLLAQAGDDKWPGFPTG